MRFFVFVCVCVCVAYSAFHFLFPFVSLTLAPIQRIEAFMQNAAGVVVKIKTGRIFIFTLQHRHINGNLIVRLNKWNYVEWITLKFRLHYHSRPLLPHKVKPRTMCAKIYIYIYVYATHTTRGGAMNGKPNRLTCSTKTSIQTKCDTKSFSYQTSTKHVIVNWFKCC